MADFLTGKKSTENNSGLGQRGGILIIKGRMMGTLGTVEVTVLNL